MNLEQEDKVTKQIKINENNRIRIVGKQYFQISQEKIEYQLEYQNNRIQYFKDGQILLRDWIKGDFSDYEIIKDFNFLKYLIWDGQYDNQNKKIGKWTPYWNGDKLDAGGYYDEGGFKIGLWKEPYNMFRDLEQYYFFGEYKKGKRIGKWEYCYYSYSSKKKEQTFHFKAGGYYDNYGIKQGKWIEFVDGFSFFQASLSDKKQKIVNIGEYKNGRKFGIWEMQFDEKLSISGTYDMNGQKNGIWSDIYDFSFGENRIIQTGNYKENVRQGEWQIKLQYDYKMWEEFFQEEIFGGVYDEDGLKVGKWIELHDNFLQCPAINVGIYEKGIKVGKWDIIDQDGGGQFDNFGQKLGDWIEVIHFDPVYICFSGTYTDGKRHGEWIYYGEETMYEFQHNQFSGGGKYDENGMKYGTWLEFQEYFNSSELLCKGTYINNKKVGSWNNQCQNYDLPQIIENLGEYDENELKNGFWVEPSVDFWVLNKIIFAGEYKNGIKVGNWEILQNQNSNNILRGGGDYNEQGRKHGLWIDIRHDFNMTKIKFIQGEYSNGKKIGEFTVIG
ncbi:unnamed protein product (macronuclear) [Paramecium tetraurelia]|uniref:Uncharacterized protein n=1 Tax=Paramecium tetraurelia TaxID=5888 RepID=A0BAJ9_PARTE|nr:uncharacterized protein GSPATT00000001001 [Paramecium tetraurelia]CAK55566.1 unnamed protein product [Paramecium tetraurelia]|eukprot:XP_001422964.1 hypothetical protein (macronuclear) [Paramecium tetraurelia strain d4-2]